MITHRIGRAGRCAALALLASIAFGSAAQAGGEVNIYSYRQPFLIEPMLKAFTEKTGIETNIIYAQKGLVERVKAEGRNSPADVLLTVDIGRLTRAVDNDITQAVDSKVLNENIPAEYRDSDGHWFGLTTRVRVVLASKERVEQDSITYEELADPKWRGRICTRSGQHVYNIALFASMIAHHGEAWTKGWLTNLKKNLARKPASNDRAQIKGVYSGECDLAIVNHYYLAALKTHDKDSEQMKWANSVKLLFPNTEGRGSHVNVSGVALAKSAPNKENALKLMEFLSSGKGQQLYGAVNNEYPVKESVPAGEIAESFGAFKRDDLSLEKVAEFRLKASELVDEVGYNQGPGS